MRHQGKITKWMDDKGFGFITQEGSNEQLFVHISGFEKGKERPHVGEIVSYEVASDVKKGLQAYKVKYLNRAAENQANSTNFRKKSDKSSSLGVWIFVGILLIAAYLHKQVYELAIQEIEETGRAAESRMIHELVAQSFKCSGKTKCTEMLSCDEAMFYLNSCPGTIADGDGDGIPCEDQWCGH